MNTSKSQTNVVPEILFVYNPQAGGAHRSLLRRLIKAHFAGRQVELLEVQTEEETRAQIQSFLDRGVHLVVVAGGDGTISSVAATLVNTNVPLGILPLGTGNVLARELKIPLKPDLAAKLLSQRFSIRRLDALRVADRVYLLAVSVGLSAMTMRRTRRRHKRRFGRMAYLWAFLLNLVGLPLHNFELEVDGKPMQLRANELMAVNVAAIGYRALRWGPNVLPDDGVLDLCFIRVRTLLHYFQVFFGILARQEKYGPRLNCTPVRKSIVIRSPEGLLVQGDGDLIGRTPIEIFLLPAALKIAVPSPRN